MILFLVVLGLCVLATFFLSRPDSLNYRAREVNAAQHDSPRYRVRR